MVQAQAFLLRNADLITRTKGKPNVQHHDLSQPRLRHLAPAWSRCNTNWSTLFNQAPGSTNAYVLGGDMESSGAQHAARWWHVPLTAGTWAFDMLHTTGSNRGIYSVRIDDAEVGTIDGYATNPGTKNVRSRVSGIKVAGTGYHKLSLVMATKNASSSLYAGTVAMLGLRRTA